MAAEISTDLVLVSTSAPIRSVVRHALRARAPHAERRSARRPWLRLLSELLHMAGPAAEFVRHGERPWSSATFTGARHTVLLAFNGEEALRRGEAFIAVLPDHEFTIPGHLVADATVTAVDHTNGVGMTVEIELLVLEDA